MILRGSEEADELAEFYMSRQVVPTKYFDDAQHVAICTVARVEYLVSWNFKHLANLHRENAFNAANPLRGYSKNDLVATPELELQPGDLVLRDRGYLTKSEIQRHQDNEADFIYRHKSGSH